MAIVKVYHRNLAKQLERKGFYITGSAGDGINKPVEFCLAGDPKKLSEREKPYVHVVGRLKPKKEQMYGRKDQVV